MAFLLTPLFNGMMHALFKQEGATLNIGIMADKPVQDFIQAHASVLDSGFKKVEMSEAMRRRLTRSDYIFSGMKTFHELNEAFPSLLDENGNRKTFEAFLNDVRKIDRTYNRNYLRAEFNFVQASATMAAKWEDFMEDGDRYYLQYRTAGDNRVRPAHAALNGVTLPISDSFWSEYYPPNGWNCFVAGTPVLTSDGWKAIETIRKGDSVIGGSGYHRIVIGEHAKTVEQQLVRIITKGAMTTCTENHRFLTPQGWMAAREIQPGDIIIQVGKNATLHKVINAVGNVSTLCRKVLMSLITQRKAVATLTINQNAGYRTVVHTPMLHQPAVTALFHNVPLFGGIHNPHAFNGFNSFFHFIRKTLFHNRYVLVKDKVTTKKVETTVFNLSIDQDESYVVPVGITHNCRCNVVQVRKSKYPPTPHDEAMALGEEALQRDTKGMFRFNAGKEQKTVPDYNPYTIRRCKDCDIAKGKLKLAKVFIPDNELCAACKLIRTCEQNRERSYRHGKGTVSISNMVNPNDSDYDKLIQVAEFFAKNGADVRLTPKMSRPPKFNYECVYGSLMGTKYEGKCPDLSINGRWYEHEGFISNNPKRAFRNMLNDGLKQSDRLIIDRPDLTERYMLHSIFNRVNREGQDIKEVWLRNPDGELTLLYKKTDG